jgi:hypothetical protein
MMAYLRRLGIETDVWLSVLTGGPGGMTISLRVARARLAGSRPACIVCQALSRLVEKDHCAKQLAGQSATPDAALRAGLCIALAFGLVLYGPLLAGELLRHLLTATGAHP